MNPDYILIYEALCPDDPVAADDPRRPAIIEEMRLIAGATTEEEAVNVVQWWQSWPNPYHQGVGEFVRHARQLLNPCL